MLNKLNSGGRLGIKKLLSVDVIIELATVGQDEATN